MVSNGNRVAGSGANTLMHRAGVGEFLDPTRESIGREELEARLEELKAIARSVGGDAGLEVTLGQPGDGSYCQYGGPASLRTDRVNRSIFIDPLHLLEEGNKFIIAHEGMHAYVTRSAFDSSVHTALKHACDVQALYKEVGFASLLNYLEDCGGNTWLTTTYPAFEESEQKFYDPMLKGENPQMHTGETKAVTARLGFYPRFAQFGSEIMKRWHTGEYSTALDPSVGEALIKQEKNNERFIGAFPTTQLASTGERDALFCTRFLIAALQIMPSLRELVGKDKAQAGMQQFLNEQAQKGQQNEQQGGQQQSGQPQDAAQQSKQQSQSGQQQGGEQQSGQPQDGAQQSKQQSQSGQQQGSEQQSGQPQDGAQQGQSPHSGGPSSSTPSSGGAGSQLSPETKREVNQKTEEHRESLRKELQQQLDDLSKHLDGQGAEGRQSPADPSKQIEDLRRKIEERFDDPGSRDAKREAERHLQGLEKLKDSIDSQAVPVDELSDAAQSELKKLYDQLQGADKQRLETRGEDLLKELEDAIRQQLEGKLQDSPAPTHKQTREAKDQAAKAAKAYQQMREDAKRLEEVRRSKLSLWDAALEDVSGSVQKLYSRLERILRPAVPEWDSGHATGSRLNPFMTMQAKADRKLVNKMWEQKSLPMEREFVFSLLVDNSGSMGSASKYLHARQCAVLLSEVLSRLKVPLEISIFSDSSAILKQFDETPSKAKKNEIGGAMNGEGGGTEDYVAVRKCVESIGARTEEHKFLIVLTDGGSNDGDQLQKSLKDALTSNIRVIGLGLGDGTLDVDKYYPIGRGGLSLNPKDKEAALGPYFSKLLEEILKNPQQFVAKSLREKALKKELEDTGKNGG